MTFADLIESLHGHVDVIARKGDLQASINDVTDDSRQVKPGSVFVAVKGERVDGHDYVPAALSAGATAVVTEENLPSASCALARVRDSRRALGFLGSRVHHDPCLRLRVIGVTGTNGKTTTTYVCRSLLEAAGRRVGLIGTVAYQIGAEVISASHTTPGSVELQGLFAQMVRAGLDSVVMEVSSHALALDRTAGCEFDTAVFTNLTQDHLDFHQTMEEYFRTKLRLFTGLSVNGKKPGPKRAIVNLDDPYGEKIRAACSVPVWTYAIQASADIRATDVRLSLSGSSFTAATPAGSFEVDSRLVGEHNVANLLAAIGVALQEGLSPDHIRAGITRITNVPGRFERVEAGQNFTVVVDYAHTEDALVRVLTTAQALKKGRIITVFGCGGDRDRGKRPKMGRAAVEHSDVVVLTSDNPRTEDPMAILREVEVGVREALRNKGAVRYEMVSDRREAITAAIREATGGDIVLIAGKGHEDYQIIGTARAHFDDREVARSAILKLKTA
ncbi:MAG: UDP-N-acetylmuramoyl-L-alanyl-D-glutamate--2,6-diaminopimelate ligase [Nitrospiraceae bacterium]